MASAQQPPRFSLGEYEISTDPDRCDTADVHDFLTNHAYWALGRSLQTVATSIENSALICGAYAPNGELAAFGRVVTDLATFGWLCDVFVLPQHRGHGLGMAVVQTLVEHPDLVSVKRQLLATRDAHSLYAKFGFEPMVDPEKKWMARLAH